MTPETRHRLRRAATVLVIALGAVGGYLIVTTDWGTTLTDSWRTYRMNGYIDDGSNFILEKYTVDDPLPGDEWVDVVLDGTNLLSKAPTPRPGSPRPDYCITSNMVHVHMQVVVSRWNMSLANDATREGLAELQRLLQAVNPEIPGSDMQRLNQAEIGERVPLSPEVAEMLRLLVEEMRSYDEDFDCWLDELGEDYATKNAHCCVRLDWVPSARLYIIDKALARMKSRGTAGGYISIGSSSGNFGRWGE